MDLMIMVVRVEVVVRQICESIYLGGRVHLPDLTQDLGPWCQTLDLDIKTRKGGWGMELL